MAILITSLVITNTPLNWKEMKVDLNYEIRIGFKIITFSELKNSKTASELSIVITKELTMF